MNRSATGTLIPEWTPKHFENMTGHPFPPVCKIVHQINLTFENRYWRTLLFPGLWLRKASKARTLLPFTARSQMTLVWCRTGAPSSILSKLTTTHRRGISLNFSSTLSTRNFTASTSQTWGSWRASLYLKSLRVSLKLSWGSFLLRRHCFWKSTRSLC